MFAKGEAVIQLIEQLAPKHMAVEGDKIGLQLGSLRKEIRTALVALDVTEEVVQEAVTLGAELIIAHHAIIYRPLAHLQTDSPAGRLYEKLIKNDIAVYISHTNLDVAEGGVNDMMAEALGLAVTGHLEDIHTDRLKKLVVFVPDTHAQQVRDAMFAAGAGSIGNYGSCSFNIPGTGTFLPREGTDPFIGKPGRLEHVSEVRIETVVPQSAEKKVVQAMLKAHPYEEVAYDLYPMELKGRTFGLGRVGKLPSPLRLNEFAEHVKRSLDVPFVRVVGDPAKPIGKVAVLGGSGSRYVRHALFAGADALVTGDIDYHTAHDALAAGLSIVDPGHNAEKIMKAGVARWLQQRLVEQKSDTRVVASAVDTETFRIV
ncbi:Nif3-like dinuclear metal center hexameric protein [Paenibacillus sp. GYB003]|uniref:Nif3-like dinuclear metal center hexameric protein n=1 Tax=Paenibacillus sp. GYB003 TaxID=2994392 RepID=UPI002F965CBF